MKRVRIRLFAAYREAAGFETRARETGAETTRQLFEELCAEYGQLRAESAALVAINDAMADWDSRVSDGDEVLFFPPVAGG
ncbi:MAG: MoaD/ThiS family protein [Xanthomonadales bacterium]|nr:MoaD/ThiS family protein [Xanthomonadales bacterium]